MKKIVFIFAICLCSFNAYSPYKVINSKNNLEVTKADYQLIRDCTIKVKGTTPDGKEYDLEITISDVSWLKCQAIKLLI